jgi:8-oxo-dGTP diphosphatase
MIRDEQDVIMAAGAVVWRRNRGEKVEVAVIHRPKYQDWTLPKGKCEGTETLMACAYREIVEETGLRTRLGPYLGDTFYEVEGVPKVVRYWSAQVIDGDDDSFDRHEVDEVRWLIPKKALKQLTIKDDCKILKRFMKLRRNTYPLILLRHAQAVDRKEWTGDEGDRPLTAQGVRQVQALTETMHVFGLESIHSSDALRCLDTVRPIAEKLGLEFQIVEKLSEHQYHRNKKSAAKYIKALFAQDEPILICGHNPALSKIVKKWARRLDLYKEDFALGKGDAFILHRSKGRIYEIDHLSVS